MPALELRSLHKLGRSRTALVYRQHAFSGAALDAAADRLAETLVASGVAECHRVVLLFGNTPQFVAAILAVMRAGASAVLLSPRATQAELIESIRRTEAGAILAPDHADASLPPVPIATPRTAISFSSPVEPIALFRTKHSCASAGPDEMTIQFTSGVSGRPKVVPRTTANLADELAAVSARLDLGAADATVCPCPLFHAYGLVNGFLAPFFQGRPVILMDRFLPNDVVDLVRTHRARVLVGVPVMYKAMAETYGPAANDLASLRVCLSAGTPLPDGISSAFQSRYGRSIHQLYGATETGVITINLHDGTAAGDGGVGTPISCREIVIANPDGAPVPAGTVGEVTVRSPGNATGYLDDPELSASKFRGGRYFTGDLGSLDQHGALTLSGRLTSSINVGGLKVDPSEVERVVVSFDAVAECVVVATRDISCGEVVKAVVVPRRQTTAREIQQFCRDRLAWYKVPRYVVFLDELPRSASGKVLRKDLSDA